MVCCFNSRAMGLETVFLKCGDSTRKGPEIEYCDRGSSAKKCGALMRDI